MKIYNIYKKKASLIMVNRNYQQDNALHYLSPSLHMISVFVCDALITRKGLTKYSADDPGREHYIVKPNTA